MKDLKVFYTYREDTGKLSTAMTYFRKELSNHADVMHWYGHTHRGNIAEAVKDFGADVICMRYYSSRWKDFDKVRVPKALIVGDPHASCKLIAPFINKFHIDMTLHLYKGGEGERWFNLLKSYNVFEGHRMEHMPYSVPPDIYKDYGLGKDIDILLLGRSGLRLYPIRETVRIELDVTNPDGVGHREFNIYYRSRPKKSWGFDDRIFKQANIPSFGEYPKIISRSKTMLFDGTSYHSSVPKYFECMCSGTLAVADAPTDSPFLHFIPDWNFIEVNKRNAVEKLRYYINNSIEREKIAKRGYDTIRKYHTCEIRAKECIGYLESLL